MLSPRLNLPLVFALAAVAGVRWAGAAEPVDGEFFEKRVRPVLAARCYGCHSDRAGPPKGGLRVDSRAGLLKGGDTGPAIVPGQPNESLLIDAVNYGELYQMPPKSRLPAEELAILTRWIEGGAPWPSDKATTADSKPSSSFDLAQRQSKHWCWQPIRRSTPPAVQHEAWVRQPLDRFILAKLEARGLVPAPEADASVLARRAYFDLIGLPPSPPLPLTLSQNEGERGREGEGEMGYEALVDALLASPHFGERWGRHWLDLVRYCESRGHEFDYTIPNAFEYRDYVIRALNADLPYDRFMIEHVAGDLLQAPRLHPTERFNESILGTGFWYFGEWCHSPVDIRQDECDRLDNMIDVFSKTFLGVTVACARCHDHKFDAIAQRDYYALAGYLQSSSYRLTRFETWQEDRQIAADLAQLDDQYRPQIAAAIAASLKQQSGELAERLARQTDEIGKQIGVLETDLRGARVIVDYSALPPGAWMVEGPAFGSAPVRAGELRLTGDAALPLEVASYGAARRDPAWSGLGLAETSENDGGKLAGWLRAGQTLKTPTFRLESGYVHYLIEGAGRVYAAVDSHTMINGPLHNELLKETGGNSDLPMRWITHDLSRYVGHRVHLEFVPKEDEDFRILKVVEGRERPAAPTTRPNRLLARTLAQPSAALDSAACRTLITDTLSLFAADRVAEDAEAPDRAALASWLVAQVDAAEKEKSNLTDLLTAYAAAREQMMKRIRPDSRLCIAMWDGTGVDENLLIRGNPKTLGPVVPRGSLAALADAVIERRRAAEGNPIAGSGRLELACQLVDRRNPLVSRVIVNRVWQHLMGRGIVPSVDNFGVLGEAPTHPELLDYLAREFMEDGWSLKRLLRRIMLSSTYRQASRGVGVPPARNAALLKAEADDPQNLLFHRQNMKRLEGEALRDAILAVSGRLDRAQFGPSVPVYLTPFMQGRGRPKESGPLDGDGRRSIYVAVRRNFLSPLMVAFDMPTPSSTIGRRNVSNVPAQALILMNDPFLAEQSRLWAGRVLSEPKLTAAERIERMYRAAFHRPPAESETSAALAFLEQQRREYEQAGGRGNAEKQSWADLAHVFYNVKEFVLIP
jgi:cytochrome c553